MPDRRIRVMISSRCNDSFPDKGRRLSDIRRRIKADLEGAKLFDRQVFDVWINEDAPPDDASGDSVDVCLREVDDADVVVVLSNGNAGWATTRADVGICHAELMHGLDRAAGKVRLVSLGNVPDDPADPGQTARNQRFQAFLATQNFFRGGTVHTEDDAVERMREAVFDAVQSLVRLGVREARKGRYHTGEALRWSALSFIDRQTCIADTISDAFVDRGGTKGVNGVTLTVAGEPVLFVIHAIPAALSVAAAREMIGRPFLRDHALTAGGGSAAGPVHVIGCQKGATEAQAVSMLGFPDATVVAAPFGIYVADPVQKVQFLFLQNCRDATTTRFGVQRFFDWLAQSSEEGAIVALALSRRRIAKAIAAENA